MPMRILVACFLAIALLPATAGAVPGTMAFTARISSTNGPISGTVSMRIILYDAETGGTSVWEESYDAVAVEDGMFFAALGSQRPLDASVFTGASLWMQIDVDGVPQEPRIGIHSVPYAARAAVADKLASLDGANVASADHTHDYYAGLAAAGHLDGAEMTDLVTQAAGDARFLNPGECYLDLSAGGALDNNADADLLTRVQADARFVNTNGAYDDLAANGRLDNNSSSDLLTRSHGDGRYLNVDEELDGDNFGGCGNYSLMNCGAFTGAQAGPACDQVPVGGICKASSSSNPCNLTQPHCGSDGSYYLKTAP